MAIGLGLLEGGKVVDRTGVGTHALVVGDGFGGATAGLAGADGSLAAVLGGGDCGTNLLLKCPKRRRGCLVLSTSAISCLTAIVLDAAQTLGCLHFFVCSSCSTCFSEYTRLDGLGGGIITFDTGAIDAGTGDIDAVDAREYTAGDMFLSAHAFTYMYPTQVHKSVIHMVYIRSTRTTCTVRCRLVQFQGLGA